MSVYTKVDERSLARWLEDWGIAGPATLTPIAEGVENTNYFLDADGGAYVLTLFERLPPGALPFYLGMMRRLAEAGVPCPKPFAARDGALSGPLCGKPAALVSRLAGRPVERPSTAHCEAIGEWLARMHDTLAGAGAGPPNPRGEAWRRAASAEVRVLLDDPERALLDAALAVAPPVGLPRGTVHADLFRDNALWAGSGGDWDGESGGDVRLAGVIDFYFAGEDDLLFDLAVAANDWCQDAAAPARLDPALEAALIAGYERVRVLTAGERAAWPDLLVAAALRFWLSRLLDRHRPRAGGLVKVKDPGEYRAILAARLRLRASG